MGSLGGGVGAKLMWVTEEGKELMLVLEEWMGGGMDGAGTRDGMELASV
jgi:hypothetical protein